jgi:hypothetical protein
MDHFHIGLGDRVLRCTPVAGLAARQVQILFHSIAVEHEDACKGIRRCGFCNWCRSAETIWETFPDQVVAPTVRLMLTFGMTAAWELMSPVGMIDVIWAGVAGGDYATCSATDQRNTLIEPKGGHDDA